MMRASVASVRSFIFGLLATLGLLVALALLPPAGALAQSDGQMIQDPGLQTQTQLPPPDQVTRLCQQLGTCGGTQACGNNCCGSCCTSCGGNCGGGGRLYCPPGQTPWDGYCLPDCPPGFGRYPGYPGLCLPPCHPGCPEGYEPVPLPQCPPGYHRDLGDPNACAMDPVPPTRCPAGMNFSNNSYRCEPTCPKGLYLGEDGMCHNLYEQQCLDGYQRNPETGACEPTGDWPPGTQFICLPVCPDGWTRDLYHPTRCLPPRERCDDGFELWHGQCVTECEPGSVRNDHGWCMQPQCPDGTYPDLRGACQPYGCPQGYDSIGGTCYEPCREGTVRNPNNPSQCDTLRRDCPKDMRYNADIQDCEPIPPPRITCKKDEVWSPNRKACVKIQRKPPPCPDGYFRAADGSCIRRIQQQPVCGPNEVWSASMQTCVTRQDNGPPDCGPGRIWSWRAKACVRNPNLERVPGINLNPGVLKVPKFERPCPDGYVRDKNGRCMPPPDQGTQAPVIKKLNLPASRKLRCPPGTEPDGQGGCVEIPQ